MKKTTTGAALLAVVALLTACSEPEPDTPPEQPFDAKGTLLIRGVDPKPMWNKAEGRLDACQGEGGYSDLEIGSTVTVWSGETPVAVGQITDGIIVDDGCELEWAVPDVSPQYPAYQVEVGHRSPINYTKEELKAGPTMGIGEAS